MAFMCKENIDLAIITETWLSDSIDTAPILGSFVTRYNCFRCDRVSKRGGGTALIVNRLHSTSVVFSESVIGAYEILACNLVIFGTNIRFVSIYRAPECPVSKNHTLLKVLSDLVSCPTKCIVLGDLNLPHLARDPYFKCKDSTCIAFKDFFASHGFSNCVYFPTRRSSHLDLILSNDSSLVKSVLSCPPIGSSDHSTVKFTLSIIKPPPLRQRVRDYKRGDYNAFRSYLAQIDWLGSFRCLDNVDDIYHFFLSVIHHAMDLFIPYSFKSSPAFRLPPYLARLSDRIDKLWRLASSTNSIDDWANFNNLNEAFTKKLAKYHAHVEKKQINKHGIAALYKILRQGLSDKSSIGSLSMGDVTATNDYEKAELLASSFANAFNSATSPLPTSSQSLCWSSAPWFYRDEIIEALTKWSSAAAINPDGIPYTVIKNIVVEISGPLEFIFNRSFTTSQVPSVWKSSIVIPLLKKKPCSDPNNYRPISHTSVFGRVFEKLLKKHILAQVNTANVIPAVQHGFSSGRSVETAHLSCFNEWTKSFDSGVSTDVVFFDFSRAFDRVPHGLLIHKLFSAGVHPCIVNWLSSFISNRTFQVLVGNTLSSVHLVTSGVPQGGVLSPILFNIFTADLPLALRNLPVSCCVYADDFKVFKTVRGDDPDEHIQLAIDSVADWSSCNGLPLSTEKTCVLPIGKSNRRPSYHLGNATLRVVNEVKDLGITYNNKLCFESHYKSIVAKATRRVHNIFRVLHTKDLTTLIRVFKLYIRPILESNVVIFSPYKRKDILALERVQNMFTRKLLLRCYGFSYREIPGYSHRNKSLGLPSLEWRRKRSDLLMAFKMFKGFIQLRLSDFFTLVPSRTRGAEFKLSTSSAKTLVRSTFFSLRVRSSFNRVLRSPSWMLTYNTFKYHAAKFVEN